MHKIRRQTLNNTMDSGGWFEGHLGSISLVEYLGYNPTESVRFFSGVKWTRHNVSVVMFPSVHEVVYSWFRAKENTAPVVITPSLSFGW